MENLRIIFMGTPEFAVPSLKILLHHQFRVVAVITAPDKPKGRSLEPVPSAVKLYALEQNLPFLQPTSLKAPDFLESLKACEANLQVVVAFRMLPEAVWSMPSLGTFNLHASLLPQYRGAAPINWAIINGEKETGLTTFFIKHEIDRGEIIFQEKEEITADDDAGTLHDRLMNKGAELVLKTVRTIESGRCKSALQGEFPDLRLAPKINKETCQIDWNQRAEKIRNFVRGLSPKPAAWSVLNGKMFKIFKVDVAGYKVQVADTEKPGDVRTDNKSYLYVKTLHGWASILELQPEGKKRMGIAEYFRGNKLLENT